ncbi:hypothetical protein NB311A_10715 [Nitrobacter sp. Nb-311A]|nr:hypothetical protein NB311A_10715 [Nitrobacter sp. Nb-311A]
MIQIKQRWIGPGFNGGTLSSEDKIRIVLDGLHCVNRPFNCGLLSTLFLKPFGKVVTLGPTEQVRVAQTGRARLVDR